MYLIINFQLLSEFRGENGFLRRLGPGGLGSGSLKLKNVQKSINTVELALRKRPGSLRYSCNNITTTLIQISRLFILAFSPKLTIR